MRDLSLKDQFKGQPPAPPPPPPAPPTLDPEIEKLRQKIFKRQQAEYQDFVKIYAAEQRGKAEAIEEEAKALTAGNVNKMEDFDFRQRAALEEKQAQLAAPPRKGLGGVKDAVHKFFNPAEDTEVKAAERQEEFDLFRSQQAHDRRAYIKTLEETRRAANATVGAERDRLLNYAIFLQNLANASTFSFPCNRR